MQKIMFNDRYGLTEAVLEGRKTMTRRVVSDKLRGKYSDYDDYCTSVGTGGIPIVRYFEKEFYAVQPPLRVGDVVAIAQAYKDLDYSFHGFATNPSRSCGIKKECAEMQKGWGNKMYVEAKFMRHHIKVTDIKVERLQDITDEDCLREGIQRFETPAGIVYCAGGLKVSEEDTEKIKAGIVKLSQSNSFDTPRKAFASLIDKVGRKGTWESNPWVFCYSFELVN